MRRRVREEELVRELQAIKAAEGSSMTHDEALAQVHEKLPADALKDDKRCLEMLLSA